MLRVNHFPIRHDLQVERSFYQHGKLLGYCRYLQHQGFDAEIDCGQVVVYHTKGLEPDFERKPVARELLGIGSPVETLRRGINAHIDHLLRQAGFVCVGARSRREYISISDHVQTLIIEGDESGRPSITTQAHLRWTWELEFYEGEPWLIPLPRRRFLTAQAVQTLSMTNWLRTWQASGKKIKGININTGMHRTLTKDGRRWGTETRAGWEPLDGHCWRVCLDMHSLKDLGYSVAAFHSSQFDFDDLISAVRSSPFGKVLCSEYPLYPAASRTGKIGGCHLRFRNGTGRELKDVHRLGVLEPPPRPVRLLVVASQKHSEEERRKLRRILSAHLIDRESLLKQQLGQKCLQEVGAADGRDTIATIWSKNKYNRGFQLPPFRLAKEKKERLHYYDPMTGCLESRQAFEDALESARRENVAPIALVIIDDETSKPQHDRIMKQFRNLTVHPCKFSSIARRSSSKEAVDPTWLDITFHIAQMAGAVPWDITNLPGVDEQTVFVGIDLGHDHASDKSKVAFTLLDNRGRQAGHCVKLCGRNNERISSEVLRHCLYELIYDRTGGHPKQVIVHRDGRFLDGEKDDILKTLIDIPRITLVSVKKDTCTRLSGEHLKGVFFETSEQNTILVTNCQSQRTSMPKPIEIELVYSNHLEMRQVVSQIYWLTHFCNRSASFSTRLPATTYLADDLARTGRGASGKGRK